MNKLIFCLLLFAFGCSEVSKKAKEIKETEIPLVNDSIQYSQFLFGERVKYITIKSNDSAQNNFLKVLTKSYKGTNAKIFDIRGVDNVINISDSINLTIYNKFGETFRVYNHRTIGSLWFYKVASLGEEYQLNYTCLRSQKILRSIIVSCKEYDSLVREEMLQNKIDTFSVSSETEN